MLSRMTRKHVARMLLVVAAVFLISAGMSGVEAQTLRWPDADPGTSRLLWYAGPLMTFALAVALFYAALWPGKASFGAFAAIVILLTFASIHVRSVHRPSRS
jgi:asparagine N-glycosylation enzyme membrane subunit Stt3